MAIGDVHCRGCGRNITASACSCGPLVPIVFGNDSWPKWTGGPEPRPVGTDRADIDTLAEVHADFAVECTAAMTELRALVQALYHRARILEIEVATLKGELANVRGMAMRN